MTRDDGFTLIEVLVALTILGIGMAVLMGMLSSGLDRQRRSRDESIAMALAGSLMTQAQSANPLSVGSSGGNLGNGFSWYRAVRPYGSDDDRQAWPVQAMRITVTVKGPQISRSLSTLRLQPSP